MVRHWYLERGPGWRRSALINGLGASITAIVIVIFAIAKFALGAWIILAGRPALRRGSCCSCTGSTARGILELAVASRPRLGSHRCTVGAS